MASDTEVARLKVVLESEVKSAVAGMKEVQTAVDKAGKAFTQNGDLAVSFGKTIDDLGSRMSSTAGSFLALGALRSPFGFIQESVAQFSKMEDLQIAFKGLTGSAEAAGNLMGKLKKFAADTPFEMPELAATAKQLIAFGQDHRDVIPLVKQLGDVSAGTGTQIGDLAYLMGTLKSQGRAFTVDINQFAGRGIPIWEELAMQMFKSKQATSQVRAEVEKGKVTYTMVAQAFKAMSDDGGKFHDMMLDKSKGLAGIQSTLGDAVGQFQEEIGKLVVEQFRLKEATQAVTVGFESMKAGIEGMPKWLKFTSASAATLATGLGVLVVSWKVGAMMVGMLVGNMRHMVTTAKAAYSAIIALNAASKAQIVVTQEATAFQARQTAVIAGNARAVWAMRAAYAGLTVAVAVGLTAAFVSAEGSAAALNRQMEESDRLTAKITGRLGEKFAESDKNIDTLKASNPRDAIEANAKELEEARKQVQGYAASVDAAAKAVKRAKEQSIADISKDDSGWGPSGADLARFGEWYSFMARQAGLDVAGAENKELKERQAILDEWRARVEKLESAERDLAKTQEKLQADVDGVTRKIKEQADTMGMTAEEKELRRLADLGADVQAAYAAIAEAEQKRRRAEDDAEIKKTSASLREQIDTFKMTAHEKRMYALATSTASAEDKAFARRLSEQVDMLEYRKDIVEKGRAVIDKFKTPVEKLADAEAELSEMFLNGAIDAETYNKAIGQAAQGVDHLKASIEDAASAGSADAAARVAAYADMLSGFQGDQKGTTQSAIGRGGVGRQAEAYARQDNMIVEAINRVYEINKAQLEKTGETVAIGSSTGLED